MAALPVLSSDDEEWQTARVLHDRHLDGFSAELDDPDLVFCAAACSTSSASVNDQTDAALLDGQNVTGRGSSSAATADLNHAQSSCHSRQNSQDTGSKSGDQAPWAAAILGAHKMDPGAQYHDMRGKHDRTNVKKTVAWKVTAANHMAKIRNASLLGESHCDSNCAHDRQCMLSAFT
eukprot:6078745-Pleurochrysis_carterae.AAC.1